MEVFGRERQSGGKEKEDIVARRVKITTAHFACQTSLSLSLFFYSLFFFSILLKLEFLYFLRRCLRERTFCAVR